MRTVPWLLAAGLLTMAFSSLVDAQTLQEKPKPATKVYSYVKKQPPAPQPSYSAQAAQDRANDEQRYGSQAWWRLTTERFSAGDGGSQ